jgi:hypothetical protein
MMHQANRYGTVSEEIKRLDRSLRNLWLMCAMTFVMITVTVLWICSR